jgi:hypothetical protein
MFVPPNGTGVPHGGAHQHLLRAAWRRIIEIGLRDLRSADEDPLVTSIIGVLAIGKGQRTLGRIALEFTEDERQEMLAKSGWIAPPK